MCNTEFAARRETLLSAMLANSLCIIPAASLVTRSRDTEYLFRQDSYFHYLSGFPEPDAWLVLSNHERYAGSLSVLFCLEKDPLSEIWQGRRCGPQQAQKDFALGQAFGLMELEHKLVDLMDGHQHVYFAQGHNEKAEQLLFTCLQVLRDAPKQSKQAPTSLMDVRVILDEMRLFKSDAEIVLMRHAAAISVEAHKQAMTYAQGGKNEYHLEAQIHHQFAMLGAKNPAYGTIVGSGDNACILHYTENNQSLIEGDLVLIDAGCEYLGYAADITRTFPVSGRFSPQQAQLYQLVLDAQLAAFTYIKPGSNIKLATDQAVKVITQGLLDLGILSGQLGDNIANQSFREFFMHGLGHWLGLDVHDVGNYKIDGLDRAFEPGMVLTIEPGIYIAPDAKVEPQWQGIGIRIEDNLLITEKGYENLTQGAPKSILEIEAFMAQQGQH
jgi:Xaa-Pro aminopeptidase